MSGMDTFEPADFKGFYRALSAEAKKEFASAAQTTTGHIEAHWQYARKIPNPTRMERLYQACVQFGADFGKPQLIAFFYEPNKEREIKAREVADRVSTADDVQPPVATSDRAKK